MSTYQDLRDRALNQVGCLGQAEAQTVAQVALEEAMKFVSFHVRVPSLISSATATAPANPSLEANAITLGGGGFAITATYQCPDRLYIKKDSSVAEIGQPYEFLEYHHFQDLKSIPAGMRLDVFDTALLDERPEFSYTITPDNKLWAQPITQNNVLTFVFRKSPAVYAAATVPEIVPLFDFILVNGAVIALKEWLREPESITTLWTLFEQGLMKDVEKYDLHVNGQRKRSKLRIHRSYRLC